MINWIIAFFYFLNSYGILSLEQMLTINLLLLLICRGLYVTSYVLNYRKGYNNGLPKREQLFNKNESLYFSIKQLVLILFGILYFPLAVFISFYSLMMAGNYFKSFSRKKNIPTLKITGILVTIITPIMGIIWYTFINPNYFALAAVGLSVFTIHYYGMKISSLTLSSLLQKYKKRKISQLPKELQYVGLIFLIILPLFLIGNIAIYHVPDKQTYMVQMRDGIHLATDVHFAPGSFGRPKPVILIRTPYGKSGWAENLYLPFYLIQDFHVVIQDLRGTHDSEGGDKSLLFIEAYRDGVDTINWILDQPWSNGKIASAGVSALCINQYFYAGMNPEGLMAQQLWFGTPELFDHAIYQGSYHKSSVETWIKSTSPNNWQYQLETIFNYMPKDELKYNSTSLSNSIGPNYSNISVYGIHVGGWYDHFLQGTIDGYIGYDDYGKPRAQGHQKLIMGPWTHGSIYGGKQGELIYPDNSNGFDMILNWEHEIFDEALLDNPMRWDGARVAYYLLGPTTEISDKWNYWRYAYDWPLDYVNDEWYFKADGGLNNVSAGLVNKNFSYIFDPRHPVPNLGGQNQPFDLAGPMDQRSVENRSDVLIFETSILTEPVITVGRIWGHLFISSNCTDTDFTIKLTDVYPDNRSMLITDGSLTVRSRYNYTTNVFMSGNQLDVYELMVDCWSTAYYFAPGHRIRIAISSSNFPRFAINPNSGAPLAQNYLNFNIANNTLLVGPKYNSSIILPRLVNVSETHTIY
ncbi:MAG: CocE/NonD family hydrolase [Candidatus Odinarchaeota archaeon]